MNWPRAVEAFDRHLRVERNLSPHTRRAYLADVRQLAAYAGTATGSAAKGAGPAALSAEELRAWLASLHRERSAATIARRLSGVRAFFRFLLREGELANDPTAGLPAPKQPLRLPRPLAVDDCEVLANAQATLGRAAGPLRILRDRALVELLYGTGIRVGELVALDVRDVDLRGAQVRVMGKGGKERAVPIPTLAR